MNHIMKTIIPLSLLVALQASASDKTAAFHGPLQSVYEAAQRSAQKEWTLSFADREAHLLSFVTGRSFFSRGMECSVLLHSAAPDQVEVTVHMQKKNGQAFAFGAGDRIAQKFFKIMQSELEHSTTDE